MNTQEFGMIAAFLKRRSGLVLTPDKTYLLESRLSPLVREHGFGGIGEIIARACAEPDSKLAVGIVDAMTTNETFFFRDNYPFEALRKPVLPRLMQARAGRKQLRIWSAACSTGQEPFSISMMIKDGFPSLSDWRVDIVATDISRTALSRACEGAYSSFEIQRGLPIQYLIKFFEQNGEQWRIKSELLHPIEFRQFDLLWDLAPLGIFDVILCRNVLIYFDQQTKAAVLRAMCRQLAPDGVVILGGSESVFGSCEQLTDVPDLRGVYCHAGSQDLWRAAKPDRKTVAYAQQRKTA